MAPQTRFDDLQDYGGADLARRYRSTAGSQTTVDPSQLDALEAEVRRDGYVIVPDVVEPARLQAIT